MRTRIQLNKEILIFIILVVLGSYCFLCGLNTLQSEKNTIQLENLRREDCKNGQFVAGKIDSYIGKNIKSLGNGSYSGVSQTLFTRGKEYNFYTIPMEDAYICVMISDKNIIEKLENFSHGRGKGVYFEGKIMKSTVELNDKWYDGIEGFEGTDNIISEYVIVENNVKQKEKMIYIGVLFWIVSLGQFKYMGGFASIISKENSNFL